MFDKIGKFANLFSNMGLMKKNIEEFKQKMSSVRITEVVGGGMVTIICDGNANIVNLKIDKSLFEDGDFKMLEELIIAGVNSAVNKAKDAMEAEMKNYMKDNLSNISKSFGSHLD